MPCTISQGTAPFFCVVGAEQSVFFVIELVSIFEDPNDVLYVGGRRDPGDVKRIQPSTIWVV